MKNFSFFLLYFLCLNHIYIICDESSSTCFEYSCEKCSPEDNKYCTKCRENFYLIDGKCPCADHRCALCDTGRYHYKCLLCKNGYYNFNNDCYSDIDNCAVVKNNECTLCYDGYIYNEEEKKCERETEDNKRKCFDKFCDICLSEEKGTCEECKKGYKLEKGECFELPSPDVNNNCIEGYHYKDGQCKQNCNGLDCTEPAYNIFNTFLCSDNNECLACQNYELGYINPCTSTKVCNQEGCLNCASDEECYYCMQGYYLIGGVCKKCINGCSLCADSETCQYCFSGYKLDSDNKCILDNQMDFNVNLYQKKKFQLIKLNYKDEVIPEEANNYNDVPECDANCEKCIDSSALCTECKSLYKLEDNKCIMSCSDDNCLKCSKKFILEECEQCADGYYARGNRCYLRCSDENCKYCKMIDDEEVCTECMQGYELEKMSCKLIRNYIPLIYSIIGLLILIIFVVCFCWYRQKKLREIEAVINHRIRGGNFNNVDVYSRNIEEESTRRVKLSKDAILIEFEKQKAKYEKDKEKCQFCKKKPGNYKCDCDCIVCKEHSALKKEEGDGESYSVCFNCGKVVKKVVPIKQDCNICFSKKVNLAHFVCNCALLVCKDCYVKCKLESDKCPGCRAVI